MTLYLDSASAADARAAAAFGFVRGATTNPTLLAKAGRAAQEAIVDLCDILPGTVFHQLAAPTVEARRAEAERIVSLRPERIGLKITCTPENLALATLLVVEGFVIGITAVFSSAQVYLAGEAGARYVLPYVNRSTALQGDGPSLVNRMREVLDCSGLPTEIIAASIKTPDEAVSALLAGAHHLTLPLAVIETMGTHPLSAQAIAAFAEATSQPPAARNASTHPRTDP